MDGEIEPRARRGLTPAVVASAVFVVACGVFAVAFVAGRGGLQLPIAATAPPVAVASVTPSEPAATIAPTAAPTASPAPPTSAPTIIPTVVPTLAPTLAPTTEPTVALPTFPPGDPLLALPRCPGYPACVVYVIERGDTLSGIISRYLLDIDVLYALNPDLVDPSLIVVGQVLYLGRDPYARLDPCPDGEACWLYVVRAGDSVSEIAATFGLTNEAILAANPDLPRPIAAGQVLKLPRPEPGPA